MRQLFHVAAVAVIPACILATRANAAATVLYDATLGTAPTVQGLTYGSFPPVNYFTSTATSTTLNTSASNTIYAGFGTNAVPLPHGNFTLRFDARVITSTFTNADRAAFDVIAIDDQLRGIELAFHTNEIFSLGAPDAFARVDVRSIDTTAAITRYDLTFSGSTYTLRASGTPILSGAIRDYTAATLPAGLPNPYVTPNSIFLGDDTTSAAGSTEFSYVAVVPEPAMLGALAGLVAMNRRRRV